eukprot:COSAG04_NODE_10712_length_761_cov_1.679331_1_plen_111_part_00
MRGQLNAVECKRQPGGCGGSCRAAWGFAKWSNVPGEVVLDRCTVVGGGVNAPAVQLEIKGAASLITFANCIEGSPRACVTANGWVRWRYNKSELTWLPGTMGHRLTPQTR